MFEIYNWLYCSGLTQKGNNKDFCICGKKLLKMNLGYGEIEIKCQRCNAINTFEKPKEN